MGKGRVCAKIFAGLSGIISSLSSSLSVLGLPLPSNLSSVPCAAKCASNLAGKLTQTPQRSQILLTVPPFLFAALATRTSQRNAQRSSTVSCRRPRSPSPSPPASPTRDAPVDPNTPSCTDGLSVLRVLLLLRFLRSTGPPFTFCTPSQGRSTCGVVLPDDGEHKPDSERRPVLFWVTTSCP